ncbi:hypothetical protein NST33_23990 [Paenibacillus sp. FSL L8-0435]|uniref:hypothetical protein n=1 Tax=Paenibacillus TaxID=44249 RepID=UPI001C8D3DB2|nr:hypothetical protein [Paenibacillus xylanexedens]MBY0119395.1 hypothetical protein [Paenibacillus xylanexedens]MCF7756623.1 hypothetical protein [Paenibacillus xylanexedens]
MFDPTVYDNLKVGFENYLYDMDNLDERIQITGRKDRLEMAVMSREFTLQFCLRDRPEVTGEVVLSSSLEELAAEILETPGANPGCRLELRFSMVVKEPEKQCPVIRPILQKSWPEQRMCQNIRYIFDEQPIMYNVTAHVYFDRSVNEDQMGDIAELCEHMTNVMDQLLQLHNQ